MVAHCIFRTNIDCMKKFMTSISGMAISPEVNDLVRVYRDSNLEICLQVISRKWEFTNGATPVLICDLHLPKDHWTSLKHFTDVMKSENIV